MRQIDWHRAVKLVTLLPAFCLIMLFTGCEGSFMSADPTAMIQPPRLTADQQAIENTLGKGTMQYPLEGAYRSAFILKDLNRDGKEEAIAFFRPQSENAGTHVVILSKTSKGWTKNAEISGDGDDVDQIDFGDFDGNGKIDIAIGWTQLTTGSDIGLCIYAENNGKYVKEYKSTTTFTMMKLADLNGDGRPDILLVKQSSNNNPLVKKAYATMVSFKDGSMTELATVPLDSTVSSYAGLYVTKLSKNKVGVLVDGYKGAHQMVTELVDYENGALLDPFIDSEKGIVTRTLRDATIPCQDIDNDGTVEIPLAVELQGYGSVTDYTKKLWLVRWTDYTSGNMGYTLDSKAKITCVINQSQHYWFVFPSKPKTEGGPVWDDNKYVTVVSSDDDRIWTFKQWNADLGKGESTLFEIHVFSGDVWNSMTDQQHQPYKILGETNSSNSKTSMIYTVVNNDQSAQQNSLNLSFDQIKSGFKIVE